MRHTSLSLATAATLLLAQAALAQQPPSDANQAAGLEPEQSTAQVQQAKVQRVLTAAGFTDIKIVTSSLLVQAKSPAGKPVMMIVDPNSLTAEIMESQTPPREALVQIRIPIRRFDRSTTGAACHLALRATQPEHGHVMTRALRY
jgi:hypothetical protein